MKSNSGPGQSCALEELYADNTDKVDEHGSDLNLNRVYLIESASSASHDLDGMAQHSAPFAREHGYLYNTLRE
jgi:hypothetical protein